MIEKAPYAAPLGLPDLDENDPITVEIADETSDNLEMGEDGSMTIDLSGAKSLVPDGLKENLPFDTNLADFIDENELNRIAGDIVADVEEDERSRQEWIETYKAGIDLLGLKIEERSEPWDGACGIVHPVLAESVVRFQAEIMTETFPPAGPVKTKVIGHETKEKREAAERVRDDMNLELVDRMPEYRTEHERTMWNLPTAGCAFKKIYHDPTLGRQTAKFIGAEDFIASYGETDLLTCPRYTHRQRLSNNQIKQFQVAGVYRDVEVGDAAPTTTDVQDAKDDLNGVSPVQDTRHTVLEVHLDYDLPGFEDEDGIARPYVITIDKDSGKVLSIYRNWKEDDPKKLKRIHFVKYDYIIGFGFYGYGLIHLVGGFAKGATSILRQLVDSGTLSNLPGGLKTRGLRIKGDDTPIAPGEWRDVDVPSGSLKENLLPMPYKEPSQVLAALLQTIVEEGRKFAAVAEMKVADFDSNSPVGTTMALLERTLKVMSAVQARIYAAMKAEFKLLKDCIRDFGTDTYDYAPEGVDPTIKGADYDMVDILPVADPNAATMSQRIVQWQAVMQLAQGAPQIYDLPELHGQMLEILGVKNVEKLIPTRKGDMKPKDPVTENMAIMNGQPVKAFMEQDHESHIAVHMMAMQDPKMMQIIGQNPMAQQIQAAAMAHVMEHTAFAYRQQMEQMMGSQLPHPEDALPPEIEAQLSPLLAQAAQKLMGKNQLEAQAQAAEAAAQDPVLQQQMEETKIKREEVERKKQKDMLDYDVALRQLGQKIESDEAREQTQRAANAATNAMKGVQMALDFDDRQKGRDQDFERDVLGKATDAIHKNIDRNTNQANREADRGNAREDRDFDTAQRNTERILSEKDDKPKKKED